MDFKNIPDDLLMLDSRASAVLYRFLVNRPVKKTILLPVNICTVVPAIIKASGYAIEYVDIAAGDLCPDTKEITRKIAGNKEKYSGVLYNYTYGIELGATEFMKTLKENYPGLLIMEDRCSNMPGSEHCKYADLTLYSTGYAKQVDLGFGGYGILNVPIAEGKTEAFSITTEVDEKPLKFYMNSFEKQPEEYFKAISERKSTIRAHKAKLNAIYLNSLPKEIQLGDRFNDWRFHVLVPNKDIILKKIFSEGLFASSHFKPLGEDVNAFPVARDLQNRVINLFNDFYFTEEKAKAVCKIILANL